MELLRTERGRFGAATLGVDNQAALCLTEITKPRPGHHLVREVETLVQDVRKKRPNLQLLGHWTPGHSNIEGNEMGDVEAKRAARGQSSNPKHLPKAFRQRLPHSAAARKQAYRKRADKVAGQMWSASPRYDRLAMRDLRMRRPLRFFHKATMKLTRRQHNLLVQLRSGNIGLNGHLYRIGRALSADCPHCDGVIETVGHFLQVCPKYEKERQALQRRVRRPESIAELLTNPAAFKRVLRFVDDTKRLSTIFGDGD
ncbi:hypothetical protein SCHPADRAFT_830666 [Schizopora paradoxa]|uniref:Uncharacterized protein n=1 Tax=Schizopora paradoxa TaxID=27342 RepID=A0A0H2RIR9_9AGAM|nr:hypothetical protein SCHPADRAFT_830666 [Schizopora paradoxa]